MFTSKRRFVSVIFMILLIAGLSGSSVIAAPMYQDEQEEKPKKDKKEKRNLPLEPARKIEFSTNEGSWMSIDVSPDGNTIVFEMIGDLYTLPISGGKATRITYGMAMDTQPRFSPDGQKIVFLSDRSGGENIWTMSVDKPIDDMTKASGKTGLSRITKGDDNGYASPEWMPDGKYIVSTKTSGTGSRHIWMYHIDGGSGVDLMSEVENRWAYGPAFGSDERYIYFSSNTTRPGNYNHERFTWQVALYDRDSGTIFPVASQVGGAVRPVLSPDGKWLVYATRHDGQTGYRLRDLENSEESWLAYPVQRDDQESRYSRDLMPGNSFTPDSKSLITTSQGKLWSISVPDGKKKEIKFQVDVSIELGPKVDFVTRVEDGPVTVKQVRNARISPDGSKLAFTALHKLYVMDLPDGKPVQFVDMDTGQHLPEWSSDSKWLAFVTWDDSDGGHLYKVSADGGNPVRLTESKGYYSDPAWRPDGTEVIVVRGPWQQRRDEAGGQGRELLRIPADGGSEIKIAPMRGSGPHFADSNDRLYVYERGEGLISMRLDGTDRKAHVIVTGANSVIMGKNGEYALAYSQNHLYRIVVPVVGGEAPTINVSKPDNAAFPVEKLSIIGALYSQWGSDGIEAVWSIGNTIFRYNFADAKEFNDRVKAEKEEEEETEEESEEESEDEEDEEEDENVYEPETIKIDIQVEREKGEGTIVLRGARILTMQPGMSNDGIIEDGAIVIIDNRITQVGRSNDITTPRGAREFNLEGKTVLPGFVDTHAHLRSAPGVQRDQLWSYVANLAYGVTMTRDPQTGNTAVLTYSDLVESGAMLGPRIFATGPGVFSRDLINNLKEAKNVLKRYSEYYHTNTIKQYMVGNRKKRQWIIMAAYEQKLMPTVEGGLDMKKNITEIIDGYSGIEHSIPITPVYKDFVELFAQSGTTYTPTLLVAYGGPWAENYFYSTENVHDDEKLHRFLPHSVIDARVLRRPGWFSESEHVFPQLAAQANKIVEAGGKVGIGSHGQLQGKGYHWELWAVQSGGMTEINALRCATIFGAQALGMSTDLGSIEIGKMADLVVLNSNPLDNIRNSEDILYVMKNGLMYEGETLDMVWPHKKKFPKPYWQGGDPVKK